MSLFDGKSSGFTACELVGIPVDKYYSAEVDKHAIQVSNAIHPNQIRLGDVTKWREWNINWASIKSILAGSPCQGFSFAGRQLAFNDPRSKLFFEFIDILEHVKSLNPNVKFLLENVKMKKESMNAISDILGVEPVFINSELVSAQSRPRWYWANWPFNAPNDKGVMLHDIIQDDADEKYKVSDSVLNRIDRKKYSKPRVNPMKTGCINTSNNSPKMSTDAGTTFIWFVGRGNNPAGLRALDGKIPCLTANSWQWNNYIDLSGKVRRITERECFRLQTTPEKYIDKILSCGVSSTQLYKIAGNGWTDEVIAHILRCYVLNDQDLFNNVVNNLFNEIKRDIHTLTNGETS